MDDEFKSFFKKTLIEMNCNIRKMTHMFLEVHEEDGQIIKGNANNQKTKMTQKDIDKIFDEGVKDFLDMKKYESPFCLYQAYTHLFKLLNIKKTHVKHSYTFEKHGAIRLNIRYNKGTDACVVGWFCDSEDIGNYYSLDEDVRIAIANSFKNDKKLRERTKHHYPYTVN